MESWQREAYLRVREIFGGEDSDPCGGDAGRAPEVAAALGGLPEVAVEDGCPVVVPPRVPAERFVRGEGVRCGVVCRRGRHLAGKPCPRWAGQGTTHLGAGRCVVHGGAKRAGRAEGAWIVAHAFARELDCSPWEALLRAVRIAAGKVAYCEWVLSQASNDLELEGRFGRSEEGPGGILLHPDTGEPLGGGQLRNLAWWVQKSELWTDRLARYGKMAIDAGVAERLVQQVELEGQVVGRVLTAALGELEGEVSDELMARVRGALRRELLAVEAEQSHIQGSTNPDERVVDSTWQEPRTS